MEVKRPLCTAPFNSLLVETNKTIAPCCAWRGEYLGSLNQDKISDILQSDRLLSIQNKLLNQEWPDECLGCKEREDTSGTSARLNQYDSISYREDKKLVFLEFNSSNLCNLACIPCTPAWSTGWSTFRKLNDWPETSVKNFHPTWKIYPGRASDVERFVNQVDLKNLEKIMLKGGEPFLNKENMFLLEYLHKNNILQNITVVITTNGTVLDQRMLDLLSNAAHVKFMVSIDGVGELNEYIRYDVDGHFSSHTNDIKYNISQFLKIPGCHVAPICSVQATNVFRLDEFRSWWHEEIIPLNTKLIAKEPLFTNIVMWPEYLSTRILSVHTRNYLINFYKSFDTSIYDQVINFLNQPYLGDEAHNKFVKFIEDIDKTRNKSLKKLVPEMAAELKYLT